MLEKWIDKYLHWSWQRKTNEEKKYFTRRILKSICPNAPEGEWVKEKGRLVWKEGPRFHIIQGGKR